MRILVVGAGGVGGYFGARLLAAGREVTFLVRPGRAARLAHDGLLVRSPFGDLALPEPPTVLADQLRESFDLILLSCKAYDLDPAIQSFTPAVGAETSILPLLNGMRHIERLEERFGREAVLGGYCLISSTTDPDGRVLHLTQLHNLVFGDRSGGMEPARLAAITATLDNAGFEARMSGQIVQEMWEKWVFIATLAGATCLMRASIGDIVAAGGETFVRTLLDQSCAIAASNGFPPTDVSYQRSLSMATANGSPLSASMLHDIERGARTEGDHILGDLLSRAHADQAGALSPLALAFAHVTAYEVRRARETTRSPS